MNVCLIIGPRFDRKPTTKSLVPLGMVYLGAVARQAGHSVIGVDGVVLGRPQTIVDRVVACEPDVVGITTVTRDRLAAIETIRGIRQVLSEVFIVGGGSHLSYTAENALQCAGELDAVVVGEGEQTFAELLEHLPGRESLGEIKGLVYRDGDGGIVRNDPRPALPEINSLPTPAWDLFPLDQYDFRMIDQDASPVAGVMTSRGCPQSCVFCANSLNKKMRFLDASIAVDQLQWLHKTYGVTALNIYDDSFLASKRHAIAFCEELLRRNCRFTWWCGARPARLDAEILHLMRRAGCTCVSFGVETGSDEVLKAIRKNFTTEQVREAMEVVRDIGFEQVKIFLITGLPGETTETIDRGVSFLREIRRMLAGVWHEESLIGQLPLIFPGTELELIARGEGSLSEEFSWNTPFQEPKRHVPLVNHRYQNIPHFENRGLPLETLAAHVKKHYWDELSAGRKRRFRLAPLRRLQVSLNLR